LLKLLRLPHGGLGHSRESGSYFSAKFCTLQDIKKGISEIQYALSYSGFSAAESRLISQMGYDASISVNFTGHSHYTVHVAPKDTPRGATVVKQRIPFRY
jgi:hypothetical protein